MAWQSMFAAGSCVVSVVTSAGTVVWSGQLSFGQSSPPIAFGAPRNYVRVSVDGDGVVTLAATEDSIAQGFDIGVQVAPTYDTTGKQVQAFGIAGFNFESANNHGTAEGGAASVALTFDINTGSATPATAAFAAQANGFVQVNLAPNA